MWVAYIGPFLALAQSFCISLAFAVFKATSSAQFSQLKALMKESSQRNYFTKGKLCVSQTSDSQSTWLTLVRKLRASLRLSFRFAKSTQSMDAKKHAYMRKERNELLSNLT